MTKNEFISLEFKKTIKDCLFLPFGYIVFFAIARIGKADRYRLSGSDWTVLALCMTVYIAYYVLKFFYKTKKIKKNEAVAAFSQNAEAAGKKETVLRELKKLGGDCVYLTVVVLVVRIAADTIFQEDNRTASNIIFLATAYTWRAVLCIYRIIKSGKNKTKQL